MQEREPENINTTWVNGFRFRIHSGINVLITECDQVWKRRWVAIPVATAFVFQDCQILCLDGPLSKRKDGTTTTKKKDQKECSHMKENIALKYRIPIDNASFL